VIQGRAGIRLAEQSWLEGLKKITHKNGGLFIVDEIFTGLGRTGKILTSMNLDPDIVTLGKALGGGMPISACVAKTEIMDQWPYCSSEAIHTGTFFGHPLACRVGYHTLRTCLQQAFLTEVENKGIQAMQKLEIAFKDSRIVKDVRGHGLFIGIEFYTDGASPILTNLLRKEGILCLPSGQKGQVLSITPALNIDSQLLFSTVDRIIEVVETHSDIFSPEK
jgi:4-aminobutyrate aminotransferase/(S)-3-amino-2-methylpropionate transaminase